MASIQSVLIVTPFTDSFEIIASSAAKANIEFVHSKTPDAAKTEMSMKSFALVLVDSAIGRQGLDLLITAWKYSPSLVGGLFQLSGTVSDPWEPRLYGARVYDGKSCLDQIRETLITLSQNSPDQDTLNKRVLLIEDLDAPRWIISRYIESLGFSNPLGVSSAAEGINVLRGSFKDFFCVVTDINMPEMNGIQFIETIRNDSLLKDLPIIVLTSVASPANLIECIKAGASGFLVKPPLKRLLRVELEKAWRIFFNKQSPRLCKPEEAHLLEEALERLGHVA